MQSTPTGNIDEFRYGQLICPYRTELNEVKKIMKNEILVHEAIGVFGEKPPTPQVKRAEKAVRRAAAILSFKEWDVNGASSALECEESAVSRMLSIFGSPGFEDISVLWFPDGKFLVYLRETDDDGREPPF